MPDEPKTWHFGLVAEWWAEFNVARSEELAYYGRAIERYGQPGLDLACGAGRLLLPLLHAGLTVDGCDISPDMLARCRERAMQQGLSPRLYNQAMQALDLPQQYGTIYICDSFGIGGRREQDAEALRRCYRHLMPGGALVFSHYLPYGNAHGWSYWLPERCRQLPEPWPETGTRRQAANGDEYELRSRLAGLDPLEQRLTLEMRAALYREGRLVRQEEHLLQENLYFYHEVLFLLDQAGFGDVAVYGGYGEAASTQDDTMLVFVARK